MLSICIIRILNGIYCKTQIYQQILNLLYLFYYNNNSDFIVTYIIKNNHLKLR